MTTLELTLNLPDELAQRAQSAGLLTPEAIEAMLRAQLKKQAGEELGRMMKKFHAANIPPMTMDEIQEEVRAVRAEKRKNSAS